MKRKVILLPILLCIIFFTESLQVNASQHLKAAFIRGGNLWVKAAGEEFQITEKGNVSSPKWSPDGTRIAYQQDGQIKIYNVKTETTRNVTRNGSNFQWSPDQNVLAFLNDSILNMYDASKGSDSGHFVNVALGVDNYSWLPDGSGFLASAGADLHPDGWTRPVLYKIPAEPGLNPEKAERFFTIPSELGDGNEKILSIGTTTFKWSPDGKWIAFIVFPTASWSADSNMLCVLSADGRAFHAVDIMLDHPGWFQWSPSKDRLGYIAGYGREWLFHNKEFKVAQPPGFHGKGYTPEGFLPLSFTWVDNETVVSSRGTRKNDQGHPMRSLVRVGLKENRQQKITSPPKPFGDFAPRYFRIEKQLGWIRANERQASFWLANPDGTKARKWIEGIDSGFYAGNGSHVIDVFED